MDFWKFLSDLVYINIHVKSVLTQCFFCNSVSNLLICFKYLFFQRSNSSFAFFRARISAFELISLSVSAVTIWFINELVPNDYLGQIITLCVERRGRQINMTYSNRQVSVTYDLPMNEVVSDFFDRLKKVLVAKYLKRMSCLIFNFEFGPFFVQFGRFHRTGVRRCLTVVGRHRMPTELDK